MINSSSPAKFQEYDQLTYPVLWLCRMCNWGCQWRMKKMCAEWELRCKLKVWSIKLSFIILTSVFPKYNHQSFSTKPASVWNILCMMSILTLQLRCVQGFWKLYVNLRGKLWLWLGLCPRAGCWRKFGEWIAKRAFYPPTVRFQHSWIQILFLRDLVHIKRRVAVHRSTFHLHIQLLTNNLDPPSRHIHSTIAQVALTCELTALPISAPPAVHPTAVIGLPSLEESLGLPTSMKIFTIPAKWCRWCLPTKASSGGDIQ